jgi:hypothetical protein
VALLEKRRFLYNHSGDFPQVILIVPSHVPNISKPNKKTCYVPDSLFCLSFYITRLDLFNDIIFYYLNQPSTNKFFYPGKVFIRLMKKSSRNCLQGHGEHLLWRLRISLYDVMMTYAYKSRVLINYFMELTILVLKGSVA